MESSEQVSVLKGLADEARKLSQNNHLRDKIPMEDQERVRDELVRLAETLVSEHGLTIPEARRVLHELLDVSV